MPGQGCGLDKGWVWGSKEKRRYGDISLVIGRLNSLLFSVSGKNGVNLVESKNIPAAGDAGEQRC